MVWSSLADSFKNLIHQNGKPITTTTYTKVALMDHTEDDSSYDYLDNEDHPLLSDTSNFVMVEHNRGIYKMKWIQRVKTNEYPYVQVIRPKNGWEVDSIPRDIKNAVDEIMYDIANHEAEPENWSPGAGNAN